MERGERDVQEVQEVERVQWVQGVERRRSFLFWFPKKEKNGKNTTNKSCTIKSYFGCGFECGDLSANKTFFGNIGKKILFVFFKGFVFFILFLKS